ncbi:Uncharacterised protein [Proteus vulgaris]|uniref:Uncharacterized protein n=1 Tax=Proteus vulgaris TaxID=585 RepID=A0A379FCE2_PROVU|nr:MULTISPECIES: hypothetical protein [Proteus]MCO8052286.1 hypothetical protein [Proteus penneri]SUC17324.1 Uncharacterised protein [Proteus vulgaris]
MNVSNSYPTDKYPQLASPSLAKNREEALAQAIAMIEGHLPNTSVKEREKRLAMKLLHMNLDASKNHPPLPAHIQALRDAERNSVSSHNIEIDYYGSDRRQGQYLGD